MRYKGHRFFVILRSLAPLERKYYCGYVEVLPEDYYFDSWELAEQELFAPGGITYTPAYGKLDVLPKDGEFVGFDTLHNGMEKFTEAQANDACLELINEIERKNFEN